jgi:hypothetical protein
MTDMSEPANIRQARANRAKMALILGVAAVAWAALYLWRPRAFPFWIACLWAATSIFNVFFYWARKRKLKALDSN